MTPDTNKKEESFEEKVAEEIATSDRDYTAEREAKVIPFIKDIFASIGVHRFEFNRTNSAEDAQKERASFADFVRSFVFPQAMARKIKVNELNHTFQLMGACVQMLRSRATTPNDNMDPRLSDCALSIASQLGLQETLLLNFHDDELSGDPGAAGLKRAALYDKLYEDIVLTTFKQFEIKYNEVDFVFGLIATLVSGISEKALFSIEETKKLTESKMWGIDDIDDLDIETVHRRAVEEVAKTV